jgi:hypothetical protein
MATRSKTAAAVPGPSRAVDSTFEIASMYLNVGETIERRGQSLLKETAEVERRVPSESSDADSVVHKPVPTITQARRELRAKLLADKARTGR